MRLRDKFVKPKLERKQGFISLQSFVNRFDHFCELYDWFFLTSRGTFGTLATCAQATHKECPERQIKVYSLLKACMGNNFWLERFSPTGPQLWGESPVAKTDFETFKKVLQFLEN